MTENLGLYLHIPFCKSRCSYCNFYSIGMKAEDKFVKALEKEIELKSCNYKNKICDTIYFGGGTPSTLSSIQVESIMKKLFRYFNISKNAEITMELNPCDMTKEYLASIRKIGINRISVGIQTNYDSLLLKIGRLHTAKQAEKAIYQAKKEGFSNISIDLMYELPMQTSKDFKNTLLWAVHLPIRHMSIYSLIIEEGTRFSQLYKKGLLNRPSEEASWEMYQSMCRILPHYGFERYEISSFAQKGYKSEHNMKYWKLDDYLGLGPAACSRIKHERRENLPGVRLYQKQLLSGENPPEKIYKLSVEEEMEEFCFLQLRMKEGINKEKFVERYNKDIKEIYEDKIEMLKNKKLLKESENHIFLTEKGFAFGNYVFEQFLLT